MPTMKDDKRNRTLALLAGALLLVVLVVLLVAFVI
jgi:hypothetical protein